MTQYQCSQCGNWWPEIFFRKNHDKRRAGIRARRLPYSKCKGCEISARTEAKKPDRCWEKARNSIRHHAAKFSLPVNQFIDRFGWDIKRVADRLRHSLENTCDYCRRPYAEIGGIDTLTIDILDPSIPPLFDTNVRMCCFTCNSEKGDMSPEQWGTMLICWRQWESWNLKQPELPSVQQTGFDFAFASVPPLPKAPQFPCVNTSIPEFPTANLTQLDLF